VRCCRVTFPACFCVGDLAELIKRPRRPGKYSASYVGLELDESRLDLDFSTPDKDGWTDGKPTLICCVLDPSHDQITRPLRGAH
jgi:hypothetical protein